MIRIAGAVLVIACMGYLGMSKARKYALRPKELRNMQAALQILETEIIYGATPLPEAMELVASRIDKNTAPFFYQAGQELQSMTGCTVKEAWDKALGVFSSRTLLEDSDLRILRQLGNCLGMSDSRDQAKHLHLAMEQLKIEAMNAAERAKTHVKLWNYLGFLTGLLLVTVFY
ncbi:MAG: stage III sporulation protein AB [Firmicutes bacterium]|nr:stage III sporulation protein AB [Bacillota bacterium]